MQPGFKFVDLLFHQWCDSHTDITSSSAHLRRRLIHILLLTTMIVMRLDCYARFNLSATTNEFNKLIDALVPSYRHSIKPE